MEIKKAIIGKLSKPIDTGIVSNGKELYRLYWEILDEKVCIIDEDIAIDINDYNNTYNLLKRDEYGRLDCDIDEDKIYCLGTVPVKAEKRIVSDDRGCVYSYYQELPVKRKLKKHIKLYKKIAKK